MNRPRRPKDETRRPATLRPDAPTEGATRPTLEEIARAARELFDAELAGMGVVEGRRQPLARGADLPGGARRDASLCAQTIARDGMLVVNNAANDTRSDGGPLVAGGARLRLLAGCPEGARRGGGPGAACALGHDPRPADSDDARDLRDLGMQLEREIESFESASFDELTGLTNREGLMALGEEMLSISRTADEGAALLCVDLEGTRPINDLYGHAAGDRALRDLARILEGNFRASDLVARVGGDEFCVVMAPYTDESDAFAVAARVQAAIDAYNESSGAPWKLRVHIAGARYEPGMPLERLLALADARLAEARALRRARRH
jgi:diguanylate cyclase (GGDEF)-like protein